MNMRIQFYLQIQMTQNLNCIILYMTMISWHIVKKNWQKLTIFLQVRITFFAIYDNTYLGQI